MKAHRARRLIFTLVMLTTTFSAPAIAADALAVRYYEDAIERFNAGDASGALVQLKNALQRDPGQLSAKILLGRTYLQLGQPKAAEEELMQAQQLGADPLLIGLDLARARNAQGAYQTNIDQIVPIRYPRSQQADLWVELGIARLNERDADGARIAFEEAIKLDPLHPGGRAGLARIPLKAEQFAEAERLIDGFLSQVDDSPEAWFIKGSAVHAQGRFDEAIVAYGKAADLEPDHLEARLGEATATLESGHPGRAAALLQPLRAKYPALATVPYLLAEAYDALGREEDAKQARQEASSIISQVSAADVAHRPGQLLLYGTIALESGQLEAAYKFLSSYVETNGGDVLGRKRLARTLLGLGKPGEAQKVLVRISSSEQADAETLGLLGDAYIQLGDQAAADRAYHNALENHNGGPAIVRRLGMAQFDSGRKDQALETLSSLVEQTSGAAKTDTALLLGLLYFSEKRYAEAEALAKRLSAEHPLNLTARNLLALCALARGDAAFGRKTLEDIVSENPVFKPARYNLIKLDIAEGKVGDAEAALRSLLDQDPKDTRALLEYSRFAAAQGERRIAVQFLEQLREIAPGNVLGNIELINLYIAEGQLQEAEARAVALERLAPREFMVKETLARVQLAQSANADAAITLAEVARLAGDDPERLLHTARLQIRAGAFEDAAWSLTKVLAVKPAHLKAQNELATVRFLQRHYEAAESTAQKVLANDPADLRSLSLLGDIRMSQKRFDQAVDFFRRARAVKDSASLVISQHRALMSLQRSDEALALLREWNASHAGSAAVVDLLADHLQYTGADGEALQLRRNLVKLAPRSPTAWYKLAKGLSKVDTEAALKAAIKAHELAPNDPNTLDTLGWTYIQLGELDQGLAHLREAVARNGRSATTRYHLGVALQEFGNRNAARQQLRQALALSDTFPERGETLARLATLE